MGAFLFMKEGGELGKKSYEMAVAIGGRVDPSLKSSISSAGGQLDGLGSMAKKAAGIAAAAFATVKVGQFVGDAVNTFKTYEQSLAGATATAGIQKGSEDYEKFATAARAAGKATSKTAAESADALSYMALAGWSVNDSVSGLMPILRLSEATQADLATTSDLVTDSMSALGISVEQLPNYLDVATKANNKSNQTALQMMEAYTEVGGTLNRLGTPLAESGAMLGVLANRGMKGAEAGTSFSSILINLTKKSGESAEAMAALGINAYDTQGKFKGITNVLKEVNEKTKNLTDEQRDTYLTMIGGKTQISTLNNLMAGLNTTNAEGVSELEALQKELENADGSLNAMADSVTDTMNGAFSRLSSAADDFKIEFVETFAPYITPAINKIAEEIPKITEKMKAGLDAVKEKFSGIKGTVNDVKETVAAFMTLGGMNTDFLGVSMNKDMAKSIIGDAVGMDREQVESLMVTLGSLKEDIKTIASFAVSAMGTILVGAKATLGFIVSHMDIILPIAINLGKAYAEIKFGSMIIGAAKATKAFILTSKAMAISKVETLYLQALYAKDAIVKGISTAATWAHTAATGAWNIAAGIATTVTTALGVAFAFLTGPIGLAILAIAAVIAVGVLLYKNWDTIKEKAAALWEGIKTVFGGIGQAISGAFKSGANAGIGALNSLIRAANGIKVDIPEWVPKYGGQTFGMSIPEIPMLANGGIVTSPTLSMIGEGGENEVVFPLSKLESFLHEREQMPANENSSGEVFNIQFSPQITIQGNASRKEIDEALKISKDEFERMMQAWLRGNKRPRFDS